MGIRVVTFDVGETLLRPFPSFGQIVIDCCQNAGEALKTERSLALEAYANSYFANMRRRGGTFSLSLDQSRQVWTDIYRGFLIGEKIPADRAQQLTEKIYARFLEHDTYRLFDDALPVLRALRERGFVIGVASNWETWLPGLLNSTGISQLLDFQIISGFLGYEKPDRRVFEAVIDASKSIPASILHVGDSLTSDVGAARDAGLESVLLDRFSRHLDTPVRRISTLEELLQFPDLSTAAE
jgi:putative hydrolase of the HAD superfamily